MSSSSYLTWSDSREGTKLSQNFLLFGFLIDIIVIVHIFIVIIIIITIINMVIIVIIIIIIIITVIKLLQSTEEARHFCPKHWRCWFGVLPK